MKDVAASVRARLLNYARARRLEFQSVLTRYGIERLLYRLARSPHAHDFVLKGAQLLVVHSAEPHRPTKDLDLLAFGSDHASDIAQVFREVSAVPVEPDGLVFDASTVTAEAIRETARYAGVRVKLTATLERARIPLQVDVGFGDVVTPATERITFPVLLNGPAPSLQGYPLATVVAEKLESLTHLGLATSRMKDLYDLWHVLSTYELHEHDVRSAIVRTFQRRGTPVEALPSALTEDFWSDASKRTQWSAFLRRNSLEAADLEVVAKDVAGHLAPMMPT